MTSPSTGPWERVGKVCAYQQVLAQIVHNRYCSRCLRTTFSYCFSPLYYSFSARCLRISQLLSLPLPLHGPSIHRRNGYRRFIKPPLTETMERPEESSSKFDAKLSSGHLFFSLQHLAVTPLSPPATY